jgi:para-aminobenzoate synthetase component I
MPVKWHVKEKGGKLLCKSGGGITFMSDAGKEYYELISKIYVPVG